MNQPPTDSDEHSVYIGALIPLRLYDLLLKESKNTGVSRSDLRASLKWLDAVPENDGARRRQFEIKRQVAKTLVEKVLIEKDRTLRVVFYLDVATLLTQVGVTAEIDSVGIYNIKLGLGCRRPKILVELRTQ